MNIVNKCRLQHSFTPFLRGILTEPDCDAVRKASRREGGSLRDHRTGLAIQR